MTASGFPLREPFLFAVRMRAGLAFFMMAAVLLQTVSAQLPTFALDRWGERTPVLAAIGLGFAGLVYSRAVLLGAGLRLAQSQAGLARSLHPGLRALAAFVLACLLFLLATAAGLACLVLPGFYLAARLQFFAFFIFDHERMGPLGALRSSWIMTRNLGGRAVAFLLLLILLHLLGFACYGIGLLFSIPISVAAGARAYCLLRGATESAPGAH